MAARKKADEPEQKTEEVEEVKPSDAVQDEAPNSDEQPADDSVVDEESAPAEDEPAEDEEVPDEESSDDEAESARSLSNPFQFPSHADLNPGL